MYVDERVGDKPVGFRVPADPLGLNSGVHAEIAAPTYLCLIASQGSKLHEKQHKGHEVYTSSGHHCGVIPYSSLWRGGLPQGLMMNNTRKNYLVRGVLGLVVLARVLLHDLSDRSPDASTLGAASPIYRRRPWASSQILSGNGANNWPF